MSQMNTLAGLLADADPTQRAIVSTEPETSISYRDLREQVDTLADKLANSGLNPGERVGIVLPNGPENIVAFLAVTAARLTAAPFNQTHKANEFFAELEDGEVRAIISDNNNPALMEAVGRLQLPIWPIYCDTAGRVQIELHEAGRASREAPRPDDVALFLHTSGTTSKPKGVPLTHANIAYSVENIVDVYQLTPEDCTLLVMPLFHVHGLIGATLSTLRAGGTVVAPPRFSAGAFWSTAMKHRVSWYTAVPTIHRTLLLRADTDAPAKNGFRFIRSCSSALAPVMLEQMECRFETPVLEAYGMTEGAHQIASNPLPPAAHKSGSVGTGGRVQVAISDAQGNLLRVGEPGEVVIKGPNVMHGYYKNPEATAAAFTNGWFRTGDRGTIDEQGYVRLIGRIKELINRGGEKISPVEIDAVLLAHPAVAEAATFGMPDAKFGEEVSAAVVLKGQASVDDLQEHCRKNLADYKVPKVIHFVTELPKTATGKVQRNSLAGVFGDRGT